MTIEEPANDQSGKPYEWIEAFGCWYVEDRRLVHECEHRGA